MNPRHSAPLRRAVRHARRLRGHSVLRGLALLVVAAVSFGATGLATAYVTLDNNIEKKDVEYLYGQRPERPEPVKPVDPEDPNAGRALNILLIGSDRRDGENAVIGGENEGMRSDTTIVAHVAADRSRLELVSIPRDSRVDIPQCNYADGTHSKPQSARFNSAFSIGAAHEDVGEAAACTVTTVESLTGVYLDGWAVVDFFGFQKMVDALGGVQMCIPQEMYSDKAQLHLMPGNQVLTGTQALALARARTGTGLGNGSDLNRLGRQHELLGAIVQEVLSKNLLTDLPALYQFLGSATESLTASEEIGSISALTGLAFSLKDIPSSNIVFMTIPNVTNPDNRNEVVWASDAATVWSNIAHDLPVVPPPVPTPTATPGSTATPAAPATPTEPYKPGDPITAGDVTTVCG